jgi:hypothetical protein
VQAIKRSKLQKERRKIGPCFPREAAFSQASILLLLVGSLSVIARIGTIKLTSLLTLHVLHVPNLSCNLLSISKITSDHHCQANFYSSYCKFQELTTGRMIGNAKEKMGLYYFDDGPNLSRQCQSTCLNSVFVSKDNDFMLWHYRLGHPSF